MRDDSAQKPSADRPYEVGYCKPPIATRFGQRQPPKRRSGGTEQPLPDIAAILDRPIAVKVNGRNGRLHPHEAALHGLFGRVVKGEIRAIKQFLKECDRAGLLAAQTAAFDCVVHLPNDIPWELACYILQHAGLPPWDPLLVASHLAEYKADLERLERVEPGNKRSPDDHGR